MTSAPPSKRVAAGELLQHVSRTAYRASALYYGRDGANRYDASGKTYGVLYLAFDLSTALMESVFHKHQWHLQRRRTIALSEVKSRMVRAVGVLEDLKLADLGAPGVMASHFGLNLSQLASRRYLHTQRLSEAVHAMAHADGAPLLDGLLYPSRNNYPAQCIALFDHAQHKVQVTDDIDLPDHRDWPGFVGKYQIGIVSTLSKPRRNATKGSGP